MFEKFKEIRSRKKSGLYDLTLEIGEEDFFNNYKEPSKRSAEQIIEKYLLNREDMGKPENIDIRHDKQNHIINLTTELDYNNKEL